MCASMLFRQIFLISMTTLCASAVRAQTATQDLRSCIQAGLPLYQVSYYNYSENEILNAFYSKLCAKSYVWRDLTENEREGARSSWLGQYGNFAGDWSQGGSTTSEEVHYRASCQTLQSRFANNTLTVTQVNEIRGDQDRFIEACAHANANGVRMLPQIPSAPSGLLVLNFSTMVADRAIKGITVSNLTCELDGQEIDGAISPPRLFTNDAAQIVCKRTKRPIVVSGGSGEYFPHADITVSTNYANSSPKIELPEEVDGVLRARLSVLEGRMNPVGTIVALEGADAQCPPSWRRYDEANGRFLRGASALAPGGETGGKNTVQLSVRNMPAHDHGGSAGTFVDDGPDAGHYGGGPLGKGNVKASIRRQGGGEAFQILPEYIAVTFCVKLEQ